VHDLYLLVKVMEVVDLKGNDFRLFLKDLWDAWMEHPYFDEYYEVDEFGYAPADRMIDPICMGIYKHPLGLRGDTSYTVAELTQVCQLSFKNSVTRMLGEFVGVQPIEPWVPLSRPIRFRWGMIANSPLRGGSAYECRVLLKGILPKEVRKVVGRARKWASKPKHRLLDEVLHELGLDLPLVEIGNMKRKPSLQPPEYRYRTKGELFMQYKVTARERSVLAGYFNDIMDFWRIATGEVPSIEAEKYINQQLTLPGWEVSL